MEQNVVCKAVDYTGRTVVITGAAQGAGAGIAKTVSYTHLTLPTKRIV